MIKKFLENYYIKIAVYGIILAILTILISDWFGVVCGFAVFVAYIALAIIIEYTDFKNREIRFCALRDGAQIPIKRREDAAYDIYPCFDEAMICLSPHETKMVPTGIASNFSNRYAMILKERGSTGTKGIGQRAGVIDSGFTGEWMVPITNHDDKKVLIICKEKYIEELKITLAETEGYYNIYPYEKAICQAVPIIIPELEVSEISVEKLNSIVTERGKGMLGSSGK